MTDRPRTPDDVTAFYETGVEADRLAAGIGALELERTKELILRHLSPPARVADVGGGTGRYAEWLAALGFQVDLVDPVPLHLEQARHRAGLPPAFGAQAADARRLPFPDDAFDAVLLLGSLYHLGERGQRVQAVREGVRVCRPGGVVFAAAIGRFAAFFDAIRHPERLVNPAIVDNLLAEIRSGRRVPAERRQGAFPDAYFHLPDELEAELDEAGLQVERIYAVEGPGCLLANLDALWEDETLRERLLLLAREAEQHPHLLPVSSHLLALGRKRSCARPPLSG